MRVFKDDLDFLVPITWYFTTPDAKWVGMRNVFNSRNWYLGSEEAWPLLGEVEGAPRPWSNGADPCPSSLGPFGTADQWDQGAYLSEGLLADPCVGPAVQGFGTSPVTFNFFDEGVVVPGIPFDADTWYCKHPDISQNWYVLRAVSNDPACCLPRTAKLWLSYDGPPNFTPYDPEFQLVLATGVEQPCHALLYAQAGEPDAPFLQMVVPD